MSPLTLLRRNIAKLPNLGDAGTKSGFARLVERSEASIRNTETGRVAMSGKLAMHLSYVLGVCPKWLKCPDVDENAEIPAVDGTPLTYEKIEEAMLHTIRENLQTTKSALQETSTSTDPAEQMAEVTASIVKEWLLQEWREKQQLHRIQQIMQLVDSWKSESQCSPTSHHSS
jgi:hypothetical protein